MALDMTGITVRVTANNSKRYRAQAWDNDAGRNAYRTFPSAAAAVNWRRTMQTKIRNGEARAAEPVTLDEVFARWTEDAKSGVVRSRGGEIYKPSVIHSYTQTYAVRLAKPLGRRKVGELRRIHVQHFVDRMVADHYKPQTVRNAVTVLRVLIKWAIRHELVAQHPCDGLELPAGGKVRDRIAGPSEALDLVQTLELPADRALMATAFFAGLRRGELMALRWMDVDTIGQAITIDPEVGNYDPRTKTFGPPKSKKGARTVGIPELLVPYLEWLFQVEREPGPTELVFGRPDGRPFDDRAVALRCSKAWREGGLRGIGLHEARHSYASVMIAAGVNIKTISEWMGHSSVTITLDRYGHLLPGAEAVALGLLNTYLEKELA